MLIDRGQGLDRYVNRVGQCPEKVSPTTGRGRPPPESAGGCGAQPPPNRARVAWISET
jgi:hypothetical protein